MIIVGDGCAMLAPKFIKRFGFWCSGRWGHLCRFTVGNEVITFGRAPEFLHGGPGMVVTFERPNRPKEFLRIEETPSIVAQGIAWAMEDRWWFIPEEHGELRKSDASNEHSPVESRTELVALFGVFAGAAALIYFSWVLLNVLGEALLKVKAH